MTRKKFGKPVRGGGKKFSTDLMMNQDGTLQLDTTPKTWRVNFMRIRTMAKHSNTISGNRRKIKRYRRFGK